MLRVIAIVLLAGAAPARAVDLEAYGRLPLYENVGGWCLRSAPLHGMGQRSAGNQQQSIAALLVSLPGATGEKDIAISQISPALHADRITIPLLLIHGDDDSVVPFEQSEIMASALKRAGKPYEFVKLKGEDHTSVPTG